MPSQFFFNPDSYSVNDVPSDIFAEATFGNGAINSFTIQNDGSSNYLEIDATVDSTESTAYLKYTGLPASVQPQVYVQFRITETPQNRAFSLGGGLRIPETSITSSDLILAGYFLERQFPVIQTATDTSGEDQAQTVAQVTSPNVGDLVNVRFSIIDTPGGANDNLATASYWIEGTDESTAIQTSYAFADTAPGVAGVSLIPLPFPGTAGLNDVIQIYKFSVATEGAEAPTEPVAPSSEVYSVVGDSTIDITSTSASDFVNVAVARSVVGNSSVAVQTEAVKEFVRYLTYTPWSQPRQTQELEEDEISFDKVPRQNQYVSAEPITGVSNFFGGKVNQESSAIAFTDLRLDPGNKDVIGVEVFLHVSRIGRTQDKTIKLFSEKTIGENLADLEAEDKNTYSGSLKTWGVDKMDVDFTASTFGVSIDLQPHTQYPANTTVYIRKVSVRLILGEPKT